MNEVTTRQSTAIGSVKPKNAFQAYGEAATRRTIIGSLLKFSKGFWYYGENNKELPFGTKLIANVDELMIGWIRWENNKPVEQIMGKIAEAYQPQPRDTLSHRDEEQWEVDEGSGEVRDPWQLSNYMILKRPGDNSEEALFTFATSSKGGLEALGKLATSYGDRIVQHEDNEFPIVSLQKSSYQHPNKAYGIIMKPLFKIESWSPKAEVIAALNAEQAAAESRTEKSDEQSNDGAAPAKAKAATRF